LWFVVCGGLWLMLASGLACFVSRSPLLACCRVAFPRGSAAACCVGVDVLNVAHKADDSRARDISKSKRREVHGVPGPSQGAGSTECRSTPELRASVPCSTGWVTSNI